MNSNSTESTPGRSRGAAAQTLSFLWTSVGPLIGLAAVIVLFAVADRLFGGGRFFSIDVQRLIIIQGCIVAIAALGMTVVIISGGIDLSAGTALALCAAVLAWSLREDVAFLVVEQTNYAWATQSLVDAQRELRQVEQRKSSSAELEIAKENVRTQHARLVKVVSSKQQTATGSQADTLAARLRKLEDPNFSPEADYEWKLGVPNSFWSAPLAVFSAVVAGGLAGLLNGLLVSWLRVVPFIVTLGTMTIFRGLGNLLSGNTPIRPSTQDQVPQWLLNMLRNSPDAFWFGTFPSGVFLMLALAVILAVVLRYTVFGRYVFALGSNESTARLCGINVTIVKVCIYSLAGIFYGLAGVCLFAFEGNGNPTSGVGLELEIIAAVVIGGGSLTGGRGAVLGTLAGVGIMQVITNGSRHLDLADALRLVILGIIIICAVKIDQVRQQRLAQE